jgi:hypothetical protein
VVFEREWALILLVNPANPTRCNIKKEWLLDWRSPAPDDREFVLAAGKSMSPHHLEAG